jgi:hypothetical protein
VIEPAIWPWALGALVANHALITTAGLLPRSTLLGPNLTRLPPAAVARREVAITIDDGPTRKSRRRCSTCSMPPMPRPPSSASAGAPARTRYWSRNRRPRPSVENHGDSHAKAFACFGPAAWPPTSPPPRPPADLTGQTPRYFRATAGLRNPFLDPCCTASASSSPPGRAAPTTPAAAIRTRCSRLCRDLGPGDILLLHDGHAARMADGQPVILRAAAPRWPP